MLNKKHMFVFSLSLLIGVVLLGPKSTFGSSFLLQENFNDGNQLDGNPTTWEQISNNNNWSIQNGKYVGTTLSGTGINSRTLTGDLTWSNYALEATLTSVSGVDRHLLFRFDQNRNVKGYAIKYRDQAPGFSGHIELQRAGVTVLQSNDLFKSHVGESHRVRIEGIDNNIKVFVDGQKYIDYIDTNNPILTGKIGLLIESSQGGLTNTTEYDDVVVEQIVSFSDEISTTMPTTSPAPTLPPAPTIAPTPTSTPSPTPSILSVADLKQYSSPWGNQTYDNATSWSNNPTINRWGCALTSSSMILKYWGHNINPDALNTWLKSQVDGYIGNGLVNWLAISRYTKQHDTEDTPTLEYRRLGNNLENIVEEVNSGRPSILKLPGHFIVAKGYEADEYYINDPATTQSTLGYYGNSYLALNQFKPSHTDLSYILLTINPEYSINVLDNLGNEVGDYYLEEPLIDDVNGVDTNGEYLGIYMLPVPNDGNYRVEITGPTGTYELSSYIYNTQGDVNLQTFEGIINNGQTDEYQTTINGEVGSTAKKANIDNLLTDWNTAYGEGYITNKNFSKSTQSLFITIKKYITAGKFAQAKSVLNLTKKQIITYTPIFIDSHVSAIITSEIDALSSSL